MRDGRFENRMGLPNAERSDLKRKRNNNEGIRKPQLQIALGTWASTEP